MKKRILPFIVANLFLGNIIAQEIPSDNPTEQEASLGGNTSSSIESPVITWQRSLGGSKSESFGAMKQTSDGGLILIGQTASNNGHVSGNKGSNDIWVVKLNVSGVIEWQKCLGGTLSEDGSDIIQTADGGYLVVGSTQSSNGDVAGSGRFSFIDAWVVKLNSAGSIEWKKCYGYYGNDRFLSATQTPDGGFIFAGSSNSNFPDLTNDYMGDQDAWVVKTDASGAVQWQNVYGGAAYDLFTKISISPLGGYVAAGYTNSPDFEANQVTSNSDAWVVSITPWGGLDWSKTIAGTGREEAHGLLVTPTNILLTGNSFSSVGDFTVNKGQTDLFVSKLSLAGDLNWVKTYGGSNYDYGKGICEFAGGYLIVGSTSSSNGDVNVNLGGSDAWMIKVDQAGDLLWQKNFGGTSSDGVSSVELMSDGAFLLGGSSASSNGNLTSNAGMSDLWVAKGYFLTSTNTDQLNTSVSTVDQATEFRLYPNPAKDFVVVENNTSENTSAKLLDIQGKVVLETTLNSGLNTLSFGSLSSGLYFLQYKGLTHKVSVQK